MPEKIEFLACTPTANSWGATCRCITCFWDWTPFRQIWTSRKPQYCGLPGIGIAKSTSKTAPDTSLEFLMYTI